MITGEHPAAMQHGGSCGVAPTILLATLTLLVTNLLRWAQSPYDNVQNSRKLAIWKFSNGRYKKTARDLIIKINRIQNQIKNIISSHMWWECKKNPAEGFSLDSKSFLCQIAGLIWEINKTLWAKVIIFCKCGWFQETR